MSDETKNLDVIQRWMQAVITHPMGVEAGVVSDAAQAEIDVDAAGLEDVILPSSKLASNDRIRVYADAYYGRLVDCLTEEFPVLVAAMGEDTFSSFAFEYLQNYPSRSYTLAALGSHFPLFLEQHRPDRDPANPDQQPPVDWPDFMIGLARLEWTIAEVFDAPGVEGEPILSVDDLKQMPPSSWPTAKLEPVVCLRLLQAKYPVNAYFTTMKHAEEGVDVPIPGAADEFVAIFRRDYVVRRFEVSLPQYELLGALQNGATVMEAIELAGDATDMSDEEFATSLSRWFETWTAAGLIHRVTS